MIILVFSDSHSSLRLMRGFLQKYKPDAMIHLGDLYEDADSMSFEFPEIPIYRVKGNCDRYCMSSDAAEVLECRIDGIRFYMTHGHLQKVKINTALLLREARNSKADIALYGHTHMADCHQEPDGLWVMNPGSCGYGGTVGLVELENGKIKDCRILSAYALEV